MPGTCQQPCQTKDPPQGRSKASPKKQSRNRRLPVFDWPARPRQQKLAICSPNPPSGRCVSPCGHSDCPACGECPVSRRRAMLVVAAIEGGCRKAGDAPDFTKDPPSHWDMIGAASRKQGPSSDAMLGCAQVQTTPATVCQVLGLRVADDDNDWTATACKECRERLKAASGTASNSTTRWPCETRACSTWASCLVSLRVQVTSDFTLTDPQLQ